MLKWTWVSAIVVVLDQLSKWMAEANLELGVPYEVITHLNFTLAYNYGAAFSFLSVEGGLQRWFFSVLALIISLFVFFWMKKLKPTENFLAIALALVLGGAVGNLIDRVLTGKVTDFIAVYFDVPFYGSNPYEFAIFNVADMAITLAAILMIVNILFFDESSDVKDH